TAIHKPLSSLKASRLPLGITGVMCALGMATSRGDDQPDALLFVIQSCAVLLPAANVEKTTPSPSRPPNTDSAEIVVGAKYSVMARTCTEESAIGISSKRTAPERIEIAAMATLPVPTARAF